MLLTTSFTGRCDRVASVNHKLDGSLAWVTLVLNTLRSSFALNSEAMALDGMRAWVLSVTRRKAESMLRVHVASAEVALLMHTYIARIARQDGQISIRTLPHPVKCVQMARPPCQAAHTVERALLENLVSQVVLSAWSVVLDSMIMTTTQPQIVSTAMQAGTAWQVPRSASIA